MSDDESGFRRGRTKHNIPKPDLQRHGQEQRSDKNFEKRGTNGREWDRDKLVHGEDQQDTNYQKKFRREDEASPPLYSVQKGKVVSLLWNVFSFSPSAR